MKKKTLLKVGAILLILALIALTIYISIPLINYINEPKKFEAFIESFGIWAPLVYCLITMLQILLPFIPGEPLELIGGYAFGSILGSIYCFISEAVASIVVIILVKKYGRRLVEFFFEKEKVESLKILEDSNKNVYLSTLLFLFPGTPKDLLCYFVGLTNINTKTLIVISTLGRIPSIITSTLLGGSLNNKGYAFSIGLFIFTAIFSFVGIYLFNKLTKK